MLIVFTTAPNTVEAENLARQIVSAKLAACVQILPKMKSFYFWDGEIREDAEHLLLIKTLEDKFEELEDFLKANHSYDVPEIVAVEADLFSIDYLNWLRDYLS